MNDSKQKHLDPSEDPGAAASKSVEALKRSGDVVGPSWLSKVPKLEQAKHPSCFSHAPEILVHCRSFPYA